jgi:ankyrin repeat protein
MFEFSPIEAATSRLLSAADSGTVSEVKDALAAGANLSTRDSDGANMLLRAATANPRPEVSSHFADIGLSLLEKGELGWSSLHAFARRGWLDLMHRALDAGVPVDAIDNAGETALQSAVSHGPPSSVELLVKSGANRGAVGRTKGTLLHMASPENCAILVQLGLPVDSPNYEGKTPLHDAAYWGEPQKIAALLDLGADIERRCSEQYTPVLYAAVNGKVDCVALLLDAGANPDVTCGDYSLDRACVIHPLVRSVLDAYRARQVMHRTVRGAMGRAP